MPVPQRVNFLVGWASCPPMKALLRMVQHLCLTAFDRIGSFENANLSVDSLSELKFKI
ncbi:hypothetical protein QUB70_21615 [Microcoleus sp. A003_D6]